MNDISGDGAAGNDSAGGGPAGVGAGHDFPVVGIGASAGGIRALKEFFARVPAASGMAYVVILHLSPDHDSLLAEVLQPKAAVPVTQVKGRVRVVPNHVYVIPPNQSLLLEDGHLALSERTRDEERRAPVDIFFRTLAQSQEARAACVVLSGTGADGSMGLKRVKEMGGVCLVQDPQEAEYDGMPRHSIATGLVDYVLPVAEMPARIAAYYEQLGRVRIPSESGDSVERDEVALRHIFTQLRVQTGHDFSNYKRATVLRRLGRRVTINELTDLPAYARLLGESAGETRSLLKDLLISVTNFFRDREAFAALEREIIPKLFEGKGPADQVRVWAAGCATGEEAYSVAMLLAEHAERLTAPPAVQVFATDIDEQAVASAREGFYNAADAADVSPERLRHFFTKAPGGYRVRRELRELVLFAHHNVIKDPPFSHLDLVTCRNLLIYLNSTAQERLMAVFHFALNPGGYLFLGTSETAGGPHDLFAAADKEHHILRALAVETRPALETSSLLTGVRALFERATRADTSQAIRAADRLSYAEIHQRLLEHYGPPSVVVNEEYDIVHMSERAGQYMQLAGGQPSHNLLKIVRPELRMELRTALHQAVRRQTNVEARGLRLQVGGEEQMLNLVVRPVLRAEDAARGFILVLFERSFDAGAGGAPERDGGPVASAEPMARQLEDELVRVKAQLRVTVEQYEVQTEELKAANEELQATNEEFQATNEELETGKEELQSINEELTTVNQELNIKIEELAQANSDVRNLMAATEIGTVFIDRALRVKLFTPPAREIFNLIPADVGRPLTDITANIPRGDLLDEVEQVTRDLQTVEREVQTDDGRTFLMRLLPYRTQENLASGVVITFLDITERKRAEARLRRSEERMRLRLLVESAADYSVIFQDPEGRIEIWNKGAERMFGYAEAEAVGRHIEIIFTPEDRAAGQPAEEMRQARERGRAPDERWHVRKDGSRFYVSGVMTPLSEGGEVTGYVKIARDLTERQRMEEELRRTRDELEVRVGERTRELAETNESLRREAAERTRVERARVELLRQLVRTQEDERRRIAREIHDQLGQQSTALRLNLESLKARCEKYDELCEQIAQTQEIAARLDADVDFLAWELRPAALDDLGLATALANFGQEWSKHFGLALEFHATGFGQERLPPEVETSLYRIAQEALNNVYKHAHASRVDILLKRSDGSAVLIVEDDGVGFVPADEAGNRGLDGGLGLVGMRERAAIVGGALEIESTPRAGTTVYARVPLAPFLPEGEP